MQNGIRKIVCGISGGVDSAVAALLLKRKGYNVHGLFMTNWDMANEKGECMADIDREDAKFVCKHLQIPFHEVNFVKEYWNDVFSTFIRGLQKGQTPNPDVLCNTHIKFNSFYRHAVDHLGADAIATGHYAQTDFGENLHMVDPKRGVKLLMPYDKWKDQTLFLSQIPQEALQRTIFPLGELPKEVVKELAIEAGMKRIADRKESFGICFIGKRKFGQFIDEYVDPQPGRFIHLETKEVLGWHKGLHLYTRGQRATMGTSTPEACYVAEKDIHTKDIYVVYGTDHPALFTQTLFTEPAHWITYPPRELLTEQMFDVQFKYQHCHPCINATVTLSGGNCLIISLERPFRAVTPGQYAVLYRGDECLGSAKIVRPGPSLYDLNFKERVKLPKEFT